ncbi:GNAT family N-acetyltransferase [Amycolatopsis sp. GM8]|uniref:GNAT family N-acetyltransferase n=1 Tax=Amycolatopsis sp. GM8 TaxID=2896530 RepID=UPI001F1DAC24|nr:GNAT family N-acetyltransferase [Amycolatopsis sp. GM8]
MDDFAIEEAVPPDLPAIAEIYAHYVEHSVATFDLTAPDETEWKQRFDTELPFLVARLDGEVAGYAYCAPWKSRPAYRHTVEDSIYLAPAAVGRGIGGRLLDELLMRCQAAGVREVIAVIADPGPENASPVLHRRRGFADIGRLTRVGFKRGRWVDTLLMQRTLAP